MCRPSKFDAAFKAKVAIEALQEKEPLSVLAKKYGIAPSVITSWKESLLSNSSKAFETPSADQKEVKTLKAQNDRLMRKVGQLSMECDFFAQACEDAGLKVK
jgi:transposase